VNYFFSQLLAHAPHLTYEAASEAAEAELAA
jgi:hypothetical protein